MNFIPKLQIDEITVIDMGNLSLYLGCALERDAAKGVVKITQTVLFVKPLVYLFDIPFETETPASVEYVLGPTRLNK